MSRKLSVDELIALAAPYEDTSPPTPRCAHGVNEGYPCIQCLGVWAWLEAQPGFNEDIAKGRAQIARGESVRYRDVRRERRVG